MVAAWPGDNSDVLYDPPSGDLHLVVGWYFDSPVMKEALQRVAEYLISISESGEVIYMRDWDAGDETAPFAPTPVTVRELASKALRPGLGNGGQRYRVRSSGTRDSS